jgi:hypothetical protein
LTFLNADSPDSHQGRTLSDFNVLPYFSASAGSGSVNITSENEFTEIFEMPQPNQCFELYSLEYFKRK